MLFINITNLSGIQLNKPTNHIIETIVIFAYLSLSLSLSYFDVYLPLILRAWALSLFSLYSLSSLSLFLSHSLSSLDQYVKSDIYLFILEIYLEISNKLVYINLTFYCSSDVPYMILMSVQFVPISTHPSIILTLNIRVNYARRSEIILRGTTMHQPP